MSSSETDLAMANADEFLSGEWSSSELDVPDLKAIGEQNRAASSTQSNQDGLSATLASQRVGLNHDILPLILEDLKGGMTVGWKKAVVPLLVVNRSFFQCGADLVWKKMTHLEPAFKLLPWYSHPYAGLGAHLYNSSMDWERFELYASRIRNVTLRMKENTSMPTSWFTQLLMLPGRPDPLFPTLQRIRLVSDSRGPPLLFLLIGPSLRSLHVEEKKSSSLDDALSAIPTLSISSPSLRTFKVDGACGSPLLKQLSQVTSITSMDLSFSNDTDWRNISNLQHLSLLKSLTICAPSFTSMLAPSMNEPLTRHGKLLALTSLNVTAMQYQQCLIAKAISPRNLQVLTLTFIVYSDIMAFHLCLGLYANANPLLSKLVITFINWPLTRPYPIIPPENRADWPTSHDASDSLLSTLNTDMCIESLLIYDIPPNIAASTSPILLQSISGWSQLTHLIFRVEPGESENLEERAQRLLSTLPFPGLSVLASKFWKYCQNLEELEYHFDVDLVKEEHFAESLAACESDLRCGVAAGSVYPVWPPSPSQTLCQHW